MLRSKLWPRPELAFFRRRKLQVSTRTGFSTVEAHVKACDAAEEVISAPKASAVEKDISIENKYHTATKHSVISVQIDPNYVDARTQPTAFKRYPHFFRRFPLDPNHPLHQFLSLTSAVTEQKQYRDGCTHLLRVQPSAGALYPTELYVQIRGVKGMIDGIYHLEPDAHTLVLIYELIDDGIEGYFSGHSQNHQPINGCILLVSCVYFRSSWKYKNRSIRYCFLDSGHHLGAIEAAAYASDYAYQLLFDVDHTALNIDLGFGTQEFVTGMVVIGEAKERSSKRPVRRLRSPLPLVSGTDYFEPNRFIEEGYRESFANHNLVIFPAPLSSSNAHSTNTLSTNALSTNTLSQPSQQPLFPAKPAQWQQAIESRRSARRFYPNPISHNAFLTVCNALQQPIPSQHTHALEIYAIIHNVIGMQSGLYRTPFNKRSVCLKAGEFQALVGHLCLDQAIARDSAAVFFMASACPNYGVALQQTGLVGQRIYLAATALNIGCSGIGAFYDDETQDFLETDSPILYAIAVGQISKSNLGPNHATALSTQETTP